VETLTFHAGDGEQVSERVRLLTDRDDVAVTVSLYQPGDEGPGPHIHREHIDAFYVLEGRLVFRVGRELERIAAGAGSFVAAPPAVVHTFRNEGPDAARFLNFHAPGCGFGRYLRQLGAGEDTSWFDSDDPPPGGGPPASAAIAVPGAGDGVVIPTPGAGEISIVWADAGAPVTATVRPA
jgi:quercetin dioxygenase-like cupin family protein